MSILNFIRKIYIFMETINTFKNQVPNYAAIAILAVMFLLMVTSVRSESAIIDELAHIPSGFGYVLKQDFRLNPEHPPLLKTLAAFSGWIFVNPNFPTDTKAWSQDVNGQWDQGTIFMYESGNDSDSLIFWSRFPLMLLAIFFGWLLFSWTRKHFGLKAAFFALLFFAFSPTFLTHSRYVTTDLGAAFGFFIGIIAFLWFLDYPTWKNAALVGLVFGLAELLKFSLVLLIPLYGFLLLVWLLTRPNWHLHERIRVGARLLLKIIFIGLVGFALIWAVYLFHVWNYPVEKQLSDTKFLLGSYHFKSLAELNYRMIEVPALRPLAHYMLGVLMVNQRAAGGNTQFYFGEVSAAGFTSYFPTLYILKEPLALHIFTAIAAWFAIHKIWKRRKESSVIWRLRSWIENHFAEFASLVFIFMYWALSIASPLNIGIRHVLPTFPFIYILVARQISEWLDSHDSTDPQNWFSWLRNIWQMYAKSVPRYILSAFLLFWLITNSSSSYPNFLTYYNELGGGQDNGYNIAVDSNYDWGQDLKRLQEYVETQKIEKIGIDYFGGGHLKYYFGDKMEPWWSSRGPVQGWFAVSATTRQSAFGKKVHGFKMLPQDSYEWLKPYSPVARIGSIFVYKLP